MWSNKSVDKQADFWAVDGPGLDADRGAHSPRVGPACSNTDGHRDSPKLSRYVRWTATIAATLILGACSSRGTQLTYSQAQLNVHGYANQSLQALPAGATLAQLGPDNPLPCSDSDGAPPSTPVSIQSAFWINGLGTADNERYVSDLVNYWKGQGWRVTTDHRPDDQFVVLESAGYEVVFQLTVDHARLSIATTSPCVAPN